MTDLAAIRARAVKHNDDMAACSDDTERLEKSLWAVLDRRDLLALLDAANARIAELTEALSKILATWDDESLPVEQAFARASDIAHAALCALARGTGQPLSDKGEV